MTNLLFEPPFGKFRNNVLTSSIALWKARSRLPIRDNWTFFLALTVRRCKQILVKVGAFQKGGSLWAQILNGRGRRPPNIVGIRKLECFTTSHWRPHDPNFIRMGTIPAVWQTDGRTKLSWLIQRSALQGRRPRCKNKQTISLLQRVLDINYIA